MKKYLPYTTALGGTMWLLTLPIYLLTHSSDFPHWVSIALPVVTFSGILLVFIPPLWSLAALFSDY